MADGLAARLDVQPHLRNFGSWMAAEQRRVFLLCYRMLQDADEADTATQDTFLKAHKALNRSDAPNLGEPTRWLTRIAVNTCLDRLRSRSWKIWKRRPKPEDEEIILNLAASTAPTAEDQVFAGEISGRLAEALEKLSPRQRAVFLLKHYEDRRLDEIAEILELDLGTVKAHMARALAKLRGLLQDLYYDSRAGART
ncbi:MAG: RNA polymerase sigma factor [bacterium]|nr:RNA polymerase sigma factor [bacterium]